jgi:hypothetical protein
MPRVFIFNYALSKYNVIGHGYLYTTYIRFCKVD